MRNTRRANQVRTMQAVLPAARLLDRERNDRNGQPGHLRSAHNRQRRRWICCPPRLSTFTSHPDTGACSMKRRSARKRPVTTRQHGVPVSANLTSPRDMVRFIVLIPHAQAEGSSPHRARDDRPRCGDLPRLGAITGAVRASTHATESEWRPPSKRNRYPQHGNAGHRSYFADIVTPRRAGCPCVQAHRRRCRGGQPLWTPALRLAEGLSPSTSARPTVRTVWSTD